MPIDLSQHTSDIIDIMDINGCYLLSINHTELSIRPDLIPMLVPRHCEAELNSRGIDIHNFVPVPPSATRISLD